MSVWGKIRRMFAAAPDPPPALILTKLAEAQANDLARLKRTNDPEKAWKIEQRMARRAKQMEE